jgi:hypothetical protein
LELLECDSEVFIDGESRLQIKLREGEDFLGLISTTKVGSVAFNVKSHPKIYQDFLDEEFHDDKVVEEFVKSTGRITTISDGVTLHFCQHSIGFLLLMENKTST